jgi:hypothetical protein
MREERRPLVSALLVVLLIIAALALSDHVSRHGVPEQGGPIRGGPGGWSTDHTSTGPTVPLPWHLPLLDPETRRQ